MSLNFVIPEFNINGAGTPPLQFFRRGFNLGGGSAQPSWKDVVISGIGSLTLVNAKANGLNYLKLFGGTEQVPETYIDSVTLEGKCEQRNVPEGYTQLEYLESSGTQYFNSGVMPNQDTSVEMKAQLFDSSTTRFFAAYAPAGGTPYYGVGFSTSGKWVNQTKTSNQVTAVNADTNLHTIYKNKNILYIDGTQIDDSGSGDFTLNYPIYLLAANVGGSTSFISAGKIYYTKIWDNNTLIRNFIPCRRNSDNALGMYDTVTGTFFTNSGTGDFIAGSAVTPTPTNPIDIVCNNGAIKARHQSGLPLGYTLLEYIESTGTQYINTKITGSTNAIIDMQGTPRTDDMITFMLAPVNATAYQNGFGQYQSTMSGGVDVVTRRVYNVSYTSSSMTVNNITIVRYIANDVNLALFGSTEIARRIRNAKLYSAKIYNNDTLLRHFIPCKNSSNVLGLYDLVDGQFFTNQGTGNFVAGDTVSDPVVIYYDGTVETVTDSNQLTATAQPLLSVDTYKDTQEVLSGSVTRNVGIKVLDGTEEWTQTDGYSDPYVFHTIFSDGKTGSGTLERVWCTHFQGVAETNPNMPPESAKITVQGTTPNISRFYAKTNVASTIALFKQFLADQYNAGTPVIIVYPLDTATTETVTGQQLNKEPVTVTGSLTGLVANVVSSSHTVPTPTQPLDIVANNGVIKVSPNLFNKAGNMTAGYINSSGSLISSQSSAARVSDYIEIKPSTTYVISGTGDVAAASFDRYAYTYTADKTPIAQVPSIRGGFAQSFTTANNAKFIRVQCLNNNINTCQLELGSTATTYRPYGSVYYDGTVETVGVGDLFDSADGQGTFVSPGSSATTRIYKAFGQLPNGQYKVAITGNFEFIFQYKNTDSLVPTDFGNIDTWTTGGVYDLDKTGYYYGIAIRYPNNVRISPSEFNGTISFIPLDNSATAQPLLKVGDYQDVQSVLNGAVTRNVGVKVLTGTEEGWSRNSDRASLLIPDILNGSNSWIPICTHYKAYHGGTSLANMDDNSCKITSGGKSLLIKDTTHNTSLTDFTDYIKAQYNAGFPVIVVYPLATPTTESVTGQPMTIQAGTNIVEITQASIDNLELEVSYKAGVEVTVEEIEAVNNDESVEVTING